MRLFKLLLATLILGLVSEMLLEQNNLRKLYTAYLSQSTDKQLLFLNYPEFDVYSVPSDFYLSSIASNAGEYGNAYNFIKRAERLHPFNVDILQKRSELELYLNNDTLQFLRLNRFCAKLNPRDDRSFLNLTEYYMIAGDVDSTIYYDKLNKIESIKRSAMREIIYGLKKNSTTNYSSKN